MKIISVKNIQDIIKKKGLSDFLLLLEKQIKHNFSNWKDFSHMPRPAFHSKDGVVELMPTNNTKHMGYKTVNGHPVNTKSNKFCVVGTGMLLDMSDGYPLLFSEMTLLTALRTAATSSLVSSLVLDKTQQTFGIIGLGAQSEFQLLSHLNHFKIKEVFYYDIDPKAVIKFEKNISGLGLKGYACKNAQEVCQNSEILTTVTADKKNAIIVEESWVQKNQHINALGGDCPGKTELDKNILPKASLVVEYLAQTLIEGEIQVFAKNKDQLAQLEIASITDLITGVKDFRDRSFTIFDSVGYALEDFSALEVVYKSALEEKIYTNLDLIPNIKDVKNLYSLVDKV